MNAFERTRINEVLTKFEGHRAMTAMALGIPRPTLDTLVHNDPDLRNRWTQRKDDVKIDPASRPPLDFDTLGEADISPADHALATVHENEGRKLQLGWEAIGVTDSKQVEMLQQFQLFVGGKLLSTVDATHGGMLFAFAQTAVRFKRLSEDLANRELPSYTETAQILHAQWKDCASLLVKANSEATKAAHVRAMIQSKVVDEARKRQRKPGFKKATKVK